eukprot:11329-Heterococcus_DN1.PRE.2
MRPWDIEIDDALSSSSSRKKSSSSSSGSGVPVMGRNLQSAAPQTTAEPPGITATSTQFIAAMAILDIFLLFSVKHVCVQSSTATTTAAIAAAAAAAVIAGTRPASYSSASLSSTAELHGVLLLSDIYGWQSKKIRYVTHPNVKDFTVTLLLQNG